MKKRMDEMDRQIQLLSEERGYRVIVLALALWVLYNCWQTFFRGEAYAPLPAQILCLGARVIGPSLACEIVDAFLGGTFAGGRHQTRVDKIAAIEQSYHQGV